MSRERKFTPGPWEAYKNDQVIDDDFTIKYYAVRPVGGANILRLPGVTINQANANLIAAAPDLLEALEMIMGENPASFMTFHEAMAKAATAIKKAYGETE